MCSAESVNGGQDVWSSKESDSLSADHLVVMVNGIMGRLEFSDQSSCSVLMFSQFAEFHYSEDISNSLRIQFNCI